MGISTLLRDLVSPPEAEAGAASWDPLLRPGGRVARFELVRELGRGGMGVVWEALDPELGRAVALKAIRVRDRVDLRRERLLREAEAAARLSHPAIVTVFDVGWTEAGPYLVLELLRGRSLAQELARHRLGGRQALAVGLQVARALAHAHAEGVTHRDLTPANVFLCADGRLKVLDFGMAQVFGRQRAAGGTPGFMAPEQERGAPEDERTDVYALGLLLLRMLTGPARGEARRGGGARSQADALTVPEVPALGGVVSRLLEEDPVRRPRDGAAALELLESLQRQPAPVGRQPRPRWPLRRAVAGLLLAVAASFFLWHFVGRALRPLRPASSVAVLPFADLSAGHDQAYFADGIAEEILGTLTRVNGLRVAGRASSFSPEVRGADVREVGRKLGVRTLIEGSVRREENRVRVAVELVETRTGFRLWSDTYDRELTGVFAVEDEVARAVVAALQMRLLGEGDRAGSHPRTASSEAHDLYLQGRSDILQIRPEGYQRAAEALERAVSLDPTFAPAWTVLASAHRNLAENAEDAASSRRHREQALAAAEKAVALDPELPEAYSTRALIRLTWQWDFRGARADLDRALELGPGDPVTRRRLSWLYACLGRTAEAVAEGRRATDADPLSSVAWVTLGDALIASGDLEGAQRALDQALRLAPSSQDAHFQQGYLSLLQGRPAAALDSFGRVGNPMWRLQGVALAEEVLGHREASQQALDTLIDRHTELEAYGIAEVYGWRGDAERALEWLDRAFRVHDSGMIEVKTDGAFRGLRGDPRFRSLLERMGLPVD